MNDNDSGRDEFNIRNCTVAYIQFYGCTTWDICFIDTTTDRIVEFCTEEMSDIPMDARHVLVREEFVTALAETGVVRPTGEIFETECDGKLYKCDVPSIPMQWAREVIDARNASREQHRSTERVEIESPERDLDDEIER